MKSICHVFGHCINLSKSLWIICLGITFQFRFVGHFWDFTGETCLQIIEIHDKNYKGKTWALCCPACHPPPGGGVQVPWPSHPPSTRPRTLPTHFFNILPSLSQELASRLSEYSEIFPLWPSPSWVLPCPSPSTFFLDHAGGLPDVFPLALSSTLCVHGVCWSTYLLGSVRMINAKTRLVERWGFMRRYCDHHITRHCQAGTRSIV